MSKQQKYKVLPTIPNISPSGPGTSIKVRGYNDHITHQSFLELRWVATGKFTSLISVHLSKGRQGRIRQKDALGLLWTYYIWCTEADLYLGLEVLQARKIGSIISCI